MSANLREQKIIIIDCQSTAAAPDRGYLLEIAWAVVSATGILRERKPEIHSFLLTLPEGEIIPSRISRMTGITDEMLQDSIVPYEALQLIRSAFEGGIPVAHFAQFEQRWMDNLYSMHSSDDSAPQILCTREIARRLYPGLPRKGLRAVSGYLGYSMQEEKRAANHVRTNIAIWKKMVSDLEDSGVTTLEQLFEFLEESPPIHKTSWNYPMPRHRRLSLPDVPGVYRFLSKGGEVLYVGKASSLRSRVNSYFTKRKADGKTLELVSQVYDVSIDQCETPLEAALLEFETIRELHPPYNIALKNPWRKIVFLSPELSSWSCSPGSEFSIGPVPEDSPALLLNDLLISLSEGTVPDPDALGLDYFPVEDGALEEGFSFFREEYFPHGSMSMEAFLSAGKWIWFRRHEEDIQEDQVQETVEVINSERVKKHLEWLTAAGSRDVRQAAWFCLLGWAVIEWNPSMNENSRVLNIEAGRAISSDWVLPSSPIELKTHDQKSTLERQHLLDSGNFSRLKILNTELRRISVSGELKQIHIRGNRSLNQQKLSALYRFI